MNCAEFDCVDTYLEDVVDKCEQRGEREGGSEERQVTILDGHLVELVERLYVHTHKRSEYAHQCGCSLAV
jgi:hypothetical protein